MTERQEAFAREYLKDQCGKDAAIRAGFAPRAAAAQASRLLRHPEVNAAISKKLRNLSNLVNATPEEITRKLARIAFVDVNEEDVKPSDALKGLEILAKINNMFADTSVTLNQGLQINIMLGEHDNG